jgi:hypothetical protein
MNRVRALTRSGAILVLLFTLGACATAPDVSDDDRLKDLFAEIDDADAPTAAGLSALPFAFHDEVLIREVELAVLWQNLKAAGFALTPARVHSVVPIRDAADVGGTFLLESLGQRLEGAPVSLVEIDGADGRLFLLVEGRGIRGYVLRGIRRPL